jgi:hypothetical protein
LDAAFFNYVDAPFLKLCGRCLSHVDAAFFNYTDAPFLTYVDAAIQKWEDATVQNWEDATVQNWAEVPGQWKHLSEQPAKLNRKFS